MLTPSDPDGRGDPSDFELESFPGSFVEVMLDQIRFSTRLFDVPRLEDGYRRLVAVVTGDKRAPDLISGVLRHGRLERGDAALVLRISTVTARKTLGDLVRLGFLMSDSPKTPVRLAFPLDYRERLFPNLFADATAG